MAAEHTVLEDGLVCLYTYQNTSAGRGPLHLQFFSSVNLPRHTVWAEPRAGLFLDIEFVRSSCRERNYMGRSNTEAKACERWKPAPLACEIGRGAYTCSKRKNWQPFGASSLLKPSKPEDRQTFRCSGWECYQQRRSLHNGFPSANGTVPAFCHCLCLLSAEQTQVYAGSLCRVLA